MQPKKIGDGGASISIRIENLIASSIMEKLEICAPSVRCSIHRVPERFHIMRKPSAYKPEAVSIGPYHRANQSLKATEDLKLLYAHKLLTIRAGRESSELYPQTVEEEEEEEEIRTIKLDSSETLVATQAWFAIVEKCASSVREMETETRKCYSEPVGLDSKEFVEMMIIDGLFIIKMLIRSTLRSYDIADDPLDGNDWLVMMVQQDMFLLENQIPLFVLQCLANIVFSADEFMSLNKVIHTFITTINLQLILPTNRYIPLEEHPNPCEHAKHLLDFLIILIQPPPHIDSASSRKTVQVLTKLKTNTVVKFTISLYSKLKRTCITDEERENPSVTSSHFLPSATELSLAGVGFKKGSAQGSFLDIKFSRRTGILEIPPLCIYDETDPLLRNLIACEQSYGGGYHITSYVSMMDFLINSADDVKLLRKQGIISNYLGCDEDVSDMFNKLCVGIILGGPYYSKYINDINEFYKKRRNIWKATLKREYFKSPWAIVSVLAAILLIALTIISTVFGILSFVIHKS
ncbi:hypothetical protein MKW98_002975 [Papaver atlanticum]|uniref:Uncharacterized protein n=1 Tax=Papaver atlanticum TaxID=357466 RepID=A0AAD4TKH5_9MAGN|nr:hypothetical protein MKW98_002975 [Papaver atlanticum]